MTHSPTLNTYIICFGLIFLLLSPQRSSPHASLRKQKPLGRDCLNFLRPDLRSPAPRSPIGHSPRLSGVVSLPSSGPAPPAGPCTLITPTLTGPLHLTNILDHSLLSISPSPGFFQLTLEDVQNSLNTKKWRLLFSFYYKKIGLTAMKLPNYGSL